MSAVRVDVRRGADRFATRIDWLDSRHSFSFGEHYDPTNIRHALLIVHNEDVVPPAEGFDPHPHRDMEIVTWVLKGSLVHEDSAGHRGVITPGLVQRMSAGRGVVHSERNDAWRLSGGPEHPEPVHYVQMWVLPDETGIDPGYEQLELEPRLSGGDLVPVLSGLQRHARDEVLSLHNRNAALHAARLAPERSVQLPDAPYLHLFVPRGRVELEGVGVLEAGDAVRFTATGGQRITGLPGSGEAAESPAEVLVWEMHATRG